MIALCDSADEELRHVAIETLLTFGEWDIHGNKKIKAEISPGFFGFFGFL